MVSTFILLILGLLPTQAEPRGPFSPSTEPLRVRVEVARGRHFAGQAFELELGVVAGAQRPEIEAPRIAGARAWPIGTDLRPIATSGIGEVVAQQNLFLSRFRVVANRPGTLEIPPIAARIDGRSGRSPPKRVDIEPVPLEGRPARYLGGVGPFSLKAEAAPTAIRLGQELHYRITITGPGAWGSSGRPDLGRAQRPEAKLRVVAEPDETINEPPARTFVYRIRPLHAGEIVLPPVAIAAFDPAINRYVTKVTSSVSVRVIEAQPFNPASIDVLPAPASPARAQWVNWTAWTLSAVLLLGASLALARVRSIRRREPQHGPAAARAFAARLARTLAGASAYPAQDSSSSPDPASPERGSDQGCWETAHQISEDLTRYLELGSGRPPGALTPIEARQGVTDITGSDALGGQAEQLAAHCDRALFGEQSGEPSALGLLESARQLFRALGRVKSSYWPHLEQPRRETPES